MTLSRNEILKSVAAGKIAVTPFDASCVGACSVDLHLGNEFKTFKRSGRPFRVGENAEFPCKKTVLGKGQLLKLKPGQFALGITRERITLSPAYCARIEGRSRFARLGLMVHVSSSVIQPGSDNVQVLEIVNLSPETLLLSPGTKICQVLFEKLSSPSEYDGKFKRQRHV